MPPPKPIPPLDADHPTQSQRFIDMAREVEADEAPEALDRALTRVVRPLTSVDFSPMAPPLDSTPHQQG